MGSSTYGVIYLIENKINGKRYVGQTVTSVQKRFNSHKYASERGSMACLHRAIRRYGAMQFCITILDHAATHEDLNSKESEWITRYNCIAPNGYNITSGGSQPKWTDAQKERMSRILKARNFHHSEEAKRAIGIGNLGNKRPDVALKNKTPEMREKVSVALSGPAHPMRGKCHTETTKAKISLAGIGRRHSPETIEKMRLAKLGKPRPIAMREKLRAFALTRTVRDSKGRWA
jgi:group I intron endonuclease